MVLESRLWGWRYRVCNESALHLGGADAVPRHVDNVIDPSSDPVVAVLVPAARIPTDVLVIGDQLGFAIVELEVSVLEPLLVAVDPPQLAGPALPNGQVSTAFPFQLLALCIEHYGLDAKEGQRCGARLKRGGTRKGRDHVAASLSLPPGINNGAILLANVLVVPLPSLGIDRLTNLRWVMGQNTIVSAHHKIILPLAMVPSRS